MSKRERQPRANDPFELTLESAQRALHDMKKALASSRSDAMFKRMVQFWTAIVELISRNGFITHKELRSLQIIYKILQPRAPKRYVGD